MDDPRALLKPDVELRQDRSVRLLIAEDSAADCVLMILAIQREGYSVTHDLVDSPAIFEHYLFTHEYDVVLSDHNLQDWTASDALEIVRRSGKDIPVIIVTGWLGDERAVEYLKEGAADYVIKEHLNRLPFAIARALQEKSRREENVRLQGDIQRAKEDWERTFDAIPESIMLLDTECRIVRANRATAELFGTELANLIGAHSSTLFIPGAPGADLDDPVQRMFVTQKKEESIITATQLTSRFKVSLDPSDCYAEKIFSLSAIPIQDDTGSISGVIHTLQDITSRKRAENAKTILLKEIHHRVKNNLAVICALLHLQAGRDTTEHVRLALQACEQRIHSIAMVHEHIYRSESFDRIDFSVYAQQLGRHLFRALGVSETNVRLEFELSSISVSVAVAGACGLVLNELVTNALKHAFPDRRKGAIRVVFHECAPGFARLTVSDDGIGMPDRDVLGNGEDSLGLRIVSVLAQQLDGTTRLMRGPGTGVELTFPYAGAGVGEAGAEI